MKLGYLFRIFSSSRLTNQLQGYSYSYQMFYSTVLGTTQTTPSSRYISTRKPVTVYLIERLGFTEEQSLTISKRLLRRRDYSNVKQVTDKISFEKSDNVITYLQQHCGLDLSQVKKAVSKHPPILGTNVDKTIKPKVKLLQHLGFSTSDLAHVLSRDPFLYLFNDLGPSIQALRGIMGSDEGVVAVFKRFTRVSPAKITKNLIPNVTMLVNEFGIPRDKLRTFLTRSPQSLVRNTEWLRDELVRMEDKWGITRDSTMYLNAAHLFCKFSDEKIKSKCQVYKSYGWSDSDVLILIRTLPNCLSSSEDRIKKSLEFYMNELGYEPVYIASRPALLSYSLENRVLPRHRVMSILKEKGLIQADVQLINFLVLTEDRFFEKIILPYESNVPELREAYKFRGATSEAEVRIETFENGSKTPAAAE